MRRAMGEETNQGARNSLFKSGRSIKAAGNELQNLDRVQARSQVIGHEAVSRIKYSSDESAVKYRGTQGDRFRFRHNHLHAPFLALVSDGGNDNYPRIFAKLDVNRQLPTNGLPRRVLKNADDSPEVI